MLVSMYREVLRVCEAVRAAGGRAMLVGGWVRDRLLGKESKDYDVEVYGIEPEALRTILKKFGRVNTVGEHFAVYKLVCYVPDGDALSGIIANRQSAIADGPAQTAERLEIDVSIPRRESKSGRGHRGFTIEGDPQMTFEEAAWRRDFTINAILYDPLTDEFIDPYGGIRDLQQKRLRAVAAETFIEDSLRVLRAVQFAARFEMTVDDETAALCRAIDLADLPHERTWGEVEKLLLMAARPAIGLDAALQLGVLDKLFPELRALVGWPQDESPTDQPAGEAASVTGQYHAEDTGESLEDAFAHTKRAIDAAALSSTGLDRPRRVAVMLATLCHALGRPGAASPTGPRSNPQAERALCSEAATSEITAAATRTRAVLERLGLYTLAGYDVRAQVLALVRAQDEPREFYARREQTTDGDFRRLARRVEIALLYQVAKACALAGSASSSADDPAAEAADWFIARARQLGVEHGPPAPLILGRHLLDMGVAPGPRMGELLRQIYDLQLDGQVATLDEARAAARRLLAS
jgi:tRNA nucleotidyltransferase (CCA-adding enzyme)